MESNSNMYLFELTDTYGGEANYSWVSRFKVSAKSDLAALRKFTKETGLAGRLRLAYDSHGIARYNVTRAALCVFVTGWDPRDDEFLNVTTLA